MQVHQGNNRTRLETGEKGTFNGSVSYWLTLLKGHIKIPSHKELQNHLGISVTQL